jgi:hypothetical protein
MSTIKVAILKDVAITLLVTIKYWFFFRLFHAVKLLVLQMVDGLCLEVGHIIDYLGND